MQHGLHCYLVLQLASPWDSYQCSHLDKKFLQSLPWHNHTTSKCRLCLRFNLRQPRDCLLKLFSEPSKHVRNPRWGLLGLRLALVNKPNPKEGVTLDLHHTAAFRMWPRLLAHGHLRRSDCSFCCPRFCIPSFPLQRHLENKTLHSVLVVCCHTAGNCFKKRRKRKLQAAFLSAVGIYSVPSTERSVLASGADEAAP